MSCETQPPLILLVDDDADFLEINRHILAGRGYRVICAEDPKAALAAMERERPRLIITDLMMKSFDAGFSFARQVKEDPRYADLPVIIVTAVSSECGFDFKPRTPEDLAAMRVDAYFDKPVPPAAFLKTVADLLGRPQ
jgi:CheY-like chemotaxis protein